MAIRYTTADHTPLLRVDLRALVQSQKAGKIKDLKEQIGII